MINSGAITLPIFVLYGLLYSIVGMNTKNIMMLINLAFFIRLAKYIVAADAEKKKIKITAYVVMGRKEDNDFDYHLVLKSLTGNDSMIAEIPDPEQIKLKGFPGLRHDYAKARAF